MSWESAINADSPVWHGIKGYAAERIGALTATCVSPSSSDIDIRAAQAGIQELNRLLDLPQTIQTSTTERQKPRRRDY